MPWRAAPRYMPKSIGYGLSGDAYHITAPSEDGDGAQRCMEMALKRAGITPDDIDYINAHGTSTMADTIELGAVERWSAMRHRRSRCRRPSLRSAICLVLPVRPRRFSALLAIRDNIAPPTINLDKPSEWRPRSIWFRTSRAQRKIDIALSNSFGFGGTNASLVLRRYQQ